MLTQRSGGETMYRILFVDDEPHLLAGLRRMLRSKRGDWDMRFALGGQAALDMLAEEPADVVVSDMRMPGMDGGQLLAAVRRTYPRTVRIILSGHADRAAIISAIGPTQQYLAKPCEVDELVSVLSRVLSVRERISDERLSDLLGGVESLPKPPEVYERMMALADDPTSRLEDVVSVIETDVSTSAEVMRLVNSAFFGLPTRVETLFRAVSMLGLETIQALATAGAIFGAGGPPPPGLDPHRLSTESMAVACLARSIAMQEGWSAGEASDAFFAGLLHRIALPALAVAQPEGWATFCASARPSLLGVEQEAEAGEVAAFGCTVSEASAYLLGLWGFREPVVQAVADQPCRAHPASPAASLVLDAARHLAPDPEAAFEVGPAHVDYVEGRLTVWRDLARAQLASTS